MKEKLNPVVVYILSATGILCCCLGGLGAIPAAIGYFIANGKLKNAAVEPERYEGAQAMKTAKIIALVALIINILYMAFTIYRIYTIGWDELMEQSRQMSEQWGIEQP